MDIGGCRLLDGDGDGGGLVADLHVHLGGAGLDAVDGAGAGDRHGGPVTPPDSVGRGGVLGADHVELGEVAFLDGQFAVRDALAGDADGGVVRDRAVLVHLAGGPGDAERLGLVGLGLAVLGRVPRGLAVGVDLDQTECDGVALADTYSARAGFSEHQTGYAFDVRDYPFTNDDYSKTKSFTWVSENAYKYGFIIRFPKDKEYTTGYQYEPWHYRYCGIECATYIHDNDITFEEYYEYFIKYNNPRNL